MLVYVVSAEYVLVTFKSRKIARRGHQTPLHLFGIKLSHTYTHTVSLQVEWGTPHVVWMNRDHYLYQTMCDTQIESLSMHNSMYNTVSLHDYVSCTHIVCVARVNDFDHLHVIVRPPWSSYLAT